MYHVIYCNGRHRWSSHQMLVPASDTQGLSLRGSDQTTNQCDHQWCPTQRRGIPKRLLGRFARSGMGSVNNIQIQRGVGTSTNGAGAFGGTVSISTADVPESTPISIWQLQWDAFNTKKIGINLGTGLINNRYCLDARYSLIKSDGYVDRATSDLSSYFFSASRVTGKSSLRLNVMSGKERTYQSWYGVPEAKINDDIEKLLTSLL
jgi:hypothetical protein